MYVVFWLTLLFSLTIVLLICLGRGFFLSTPSTGGRPLGPHGQVEHATHPIGFLGCVRDAEADEPHAVEYFSSLGTLFSFNVIILILDVLFPLL